MIVKKFSNVHAVIGLGFGDEGKGVTTNSLAQSLPNPLVVRFSGGQQAAHTVMLDKDTQHVFSNFGSGSFHGVPTYWSKYCTFDPIGVMNELDVLAEKGIKPILYIDKKSPVTTPYDKLHNQTSKEYLKAGTCGVGVGATFQREEDHYSLTVGDLLYPSVLKEKLNLIGEYYKSFTHTSAFLECCDCILESDNLHIVDEMPEGYDNIIFESSQGLLLDKDIGFFPHVTWSNVGSPNILEMGFNPKLYLVTRAFQTRHGNGPMTNTELELKVKDNPYETNIFNVYQKTFKRTILDLDLLKYGIEKDEFIRTSPNKELVITCMDLLEEYCYTVKGALVRHTTKKGFVQDIALYLGIDKVHAISSPYGRLNES